MGLYSSLGIFTVSLLVNKNWRFSALNFIFYSEKSNGIVVPLHNLLLCVVASNDLVSFQIKVTSNCKGTVTGKNG
jgi:hypothetical protein